MDRNELTKQQRWRVADLLAEDRLPEINKHCSAVQPRNSFYTHYGKRIIDIIASAAALLITLPINLAIGIATFFDVGVPLFFKQVRSGKDGKPFEIVKFRNMRNTYDERGELLPASQRVTKWGKFVRKTSLDELLNFWSILKGDMTLIGPRPLPPEYLHRYNDRHKSRLAVRPGLECPPHIRIDHIWTWQEQFENDVWYVEHICFKTDVMMCIRLVQYAFDRKNAKARANVSGGRGTFMGYDLEGTAINMDDVPQQYIDKAAEAEDDATTVAEVIEDSQSGGAAAVMAVDIIRIDSESDDGSGAKDDALEQGSDGAEKLVGTT